MPILAPIDNTPVTARNIICDALIFHLNRLAPGETLADDTAEVCLRALNNVRDEWNGREAPLFAETLHASVSPISATSATLGTDWPNVSVGDIILGATAAWSAGLDVPLEPITMAQYQEIAIKALSSLPEFYAHDGGATIYFYPVPTGQTITLRVKQSIAAFTDLDTVYSMPSGYRSALAACIAALLAPTMNPAVLTICERRAAAAQRRIVTANLGPAIVDTCDVGAGPVARIKRGY
jgi:hypothetical protein